MIDYASLNEGYSKLELKNKEKYATRKHVALATAVPIATSLGLAAHGYFNKPPIVEEPINILAQPPTIEPILEPSIIPEPLTLAENFTALAVNTIPQQQNVIADASLAMLATILDPIIDILVAISFPIASIIVICAFFLIMIGNKDKAFDMMLHAGLGYILIQLSPVFLDILKTVGDAF